jgi:hypothetical protein
MQLQLAQSMQATECMLHLDAADISSLLCLSWYQ